MPIEFRLLGPIAANRSESAVPLSGSKIHTVLANLILARGRVVSDERLTDMLWGLTPPSTLNAQIYTYISRLRKRLGPGVDIARQGPGYVLSAPSSRVDVFEFERLASLGQRALAQREFAAASRHLGEAVGLWRGDPLENATEFLQGVEGPRLEAARVTALEHRVEADLALGRHHQVCAELIGLVAQFPLNERLRALLITALYRCGRQSAAVHAYHEGRSALIEQLGVDPGPELRAAYEAMLRGEMGETAELSGPGTLAAPVPAPAEPVTLRTPAPSLLPPDTVPFAGRRRELGALGALLVPEHRAPMREPVRILVTGITGIGKSCLAVHAAHRAAPHYPDGQLYAALCRPDGGPRPPEEVLVQLLRSLGEPSVAPDHPAFPALCGDLEELVRRYRARTAGKRLLIVLDGAAGDFQLGPLLPNGPGAAVLITSRTRLTSIADGHTLALRPMADDEALELLSAAAGRNRLRAEPDMAETLVRQCAGLPLALRIAGARLASRPVWPLSALVRRLADPQRRLAELSFGDLQVSRALASSLEQVHPRTRKTLPWLAMLGAEPFTARAAGDAVGMPELQVERVLEDLADASLMEMADTGHATPLYQFHPLVLLFAESLPDAGYSLIAN